MTDTALRPPDPCADVAPSPTPRAVWRARGLNLFGLVSPAANLGLVAVGPRRGRWFGVGAGVVCAVCIVVAQARGTAWLVWTATALHYALVVAGLAHPLAIVPAARAWEAFGRAIGCVMAYPIFGAAYFLAVTPTALLVRLFGKDPLRRKAPPQQSYWVERRPSPPERYDRQF